MSGRHTAVIKTLRACLKIPRGVVFVERAGWRGVTMEHTLHGSATEEQQSQTAVGAKTLRRRVFCLGPALARSAQPAVGMHRPRRLGPSQNSSPQHPLQFSDRLLRLAAQKELSSRMEMRIIGAPVLAEGTPNSRSAGFSSRHCRSGHMPMMSLLHGAGKSFPLAATNMPPPAGLGRCDPTICAALCPYH